MKIVDDRLIMDKGSVGWPLPGVQTRLIAADGQDVSNIPDIMGEIQIKSSSLMKE